MRRIQEHSETIRDYSAVGLPLDNAHKDRLFDPVNMDDPDRAAYRLEQRKNIRF